MTVLVGTMQLPVPQDADQVRAYLNGTIADGGLWTGLSRASDHDHTGGLNGKPISVASIPDGSITTGKLDPSVLLPYALVDGSKPFTGQVALNGDAIVRNTLYFGAKPAGAADVTVARTGAGALRVDNNLGVGVNPAAWSSSFPAAQVGGGAAVWGNTGGAGIWLSSNSYFDGTSRRAQVAGQASTEASFGSSGLSFLTAPAVAAGAAQTFTTRAQITQTGTLTLTPDAGVAAIDATGTVNSLGPGAAFNFRDRTSGAGYLWYASGGYAYLYNAVSGKQPLNVSPTGALTLTPDAGQGAIAIPSLSSLQYAISVGNVGGLRVNGVSLDLNTVSGAHIYCSPASGYFLPISNGGFHVGHPSVPVQAVYANTGTIQPSHISTKENVTPLDPGACVEAVLGTEWWEFDYKAPILPEGASEPSDEDKAYGALMRHQRGYVLGSPDHRTSDLFGMGDRNSASPQTDLAVVACALQDALKRIAALEGAPN